MIYNKHTTLTTVLTAVVASIFLAYRSLHADIHWPPALGKPFPDIELIDQTGRKVKMSSFQGKVILVEFIGMNCPACQAFSGAFDRGSFKNIHPQKGLESIEKLFPKYAGGLSLNDDRIVFVQILLYSMTMDAPTEHDAKKWAQHFQLDRSKNQVVLAGNKALLGQASFNLIPGFQLLDKNLIVRSDSTGHHPRHNLYTELLPLVATVLKQPTASSPPNQSALPHDSVLVLADQSTIEAAYRAIPHRRTLFDITTAQMKEDDKDYLDRFFQLTDLATVERVGMTQWISSNGQQGKLAEHYDVILNAFRDIRPPPELNIARNLVVKAIQEQQAFLVEWHQSGKKKFPHNHVRVRRSSGNLRKAYSILLKTFPQETKQNKQAFFDYLCALDFI